MRFLKGPSCLIHNLKHEKIILSKMGESTRGLLCNWVHKLDPWSCIPIKDVTEEYLSSHEVVDAWLVYCLLDDLQDQVSSYFN